MWNVLLVLAALQFTLRAHKLSDLPSQNSHVPNLQKWPSCAVSGESIFIRLNDSLGYRENVFMCYKPKKAGVLITEAKLSQKLNLIKTRKLTV